MKILYISRLFSGLETSFINQKWNPTGVPTIFKMIEVLDKNFKVNFIFTVKDSGKDFKSNWEINKDVEFKIDGLKNVVQSDPPCALFVNPNDIDDIANKITTLINSNNLRKELGKNAFLRSKHFILKKMLDNHLNLYKRLNKTLN